jgi:hypothetical protein
MAKMKHRLSVFFIESISQWLAAEICAGNINENEKMAMKAHRRESLAYQSILWRLARRRQWPKAGCIEANSAGQPYRLAVAALAISISAFWQPYHVAASWQWNN